MTTATVLLCHRADVPVGEARGFLPAPDARRTIFIVNQADRLYAYFDACPHYAGGTPMAWKKDAYLNGPRTHIACHAHGALFEIETGNCVSGPCLGQKLTAVPLTLTEDGGVHVPARFAGKKQEG